MVSYFLGLFFYIFADLTNDIEKVGHRENFIDYFGVGDLNCGQRTILIVYYSFTSLSTVGFGDLHPRSDQERVFVALLLLFGVAIFSYIMGNFIEILEGIKLMNASFDDGDNLSKFFGLIRNYNGNSEMDQNLKIQIEDFFDYKWNMDLNMAVETEEETKLLEQLPNQVQISIFSQFLFSRFLY